MSPPLGRGVRCWLIDNLTSPSGNKAHEMLVINELCLLMKHGQKRFAFVFLMSFFWVSKLRSFSNSHRPQYQKIILYCLSQNKIGQCEIGSTCLNKTTADLFRELPWAILYTFPKNRMFNTINLYHHFFIRLKIERPSKLAFWQRHVKWSFQNN